MKSAKDPFSHAKDFWKAQVQKFGPRKEALQNILSKEEHWKDWKDLVSQKDLKSKGKLEEQEETSLRSWQKGSLLRHHLQDEAVAQH